MDFLEELSGYASPTFTVERAIMTIVLAAVKADGQISDDEVRRVRGMLVLSPIFAGNTEHDDFALLEFASTVVDQMGPAAIDKAAEVLSKELRETAFAFACDMVLADGILGDAERTFLRSVFQKLRLREDVANAIVKTTVIRNRTAER